MNYPQQPPHPQQPPKSKTGLIVVIVAAVALIVALLVTGFVAPGFFLSDDDKDNADDTGSGGNTVPAAPGPGAPPSDDRTGAAIPVPGDSGPEDVEQVKQVAADAVTSINTRDAELAKQVSCEPESAGDLSGLPADARAEITGEPSQTGAEAFRVPVKFSAAGDEHQDFLNLKKLDDRWCVLDE